MSDAIIIFSKIPQAGHTMTRLMPTLTGKNCVLMHAALLYDLTLQLKMLCAKRPGINIHIYYTAQDEASFLKAFYRGLDELQKLIYTEENQLEETHISELKYFLEHNVHFHLQQGQDLGERLYNANKEVLAKSTKAITVGVDCPEIGIDDLCTALDLLDSKDMAIGASTDGGYYLIGLKKLSPTIFKNIIWSTDSVYEKSIDNANKQDWTVAELPAYIDIDHTEDIEKLLKEHADRLSTTAPKVLKYMKYLYDNMENKEQKNLEDVM